MKTRRIRCHMLLLLLCAGIPSAYSHYHEQVYQAYIGGNIQEWKEIIQQMEVDECKSLSCKLELVNYYYGYTGYLIGIKKADQARVYINKAEDILQSIQKAEPEWACTHAYCGAFLGFRMQIDRLKTPILGPKSLEYIEKSITMDPKDPQGLIEKANALFHTPEVLGGSKKEAVHFYIKALKVMEQRQLTKANWLYMKTLTDLAIAYEETGHPEQALKLYKRILYLEPEFKWVKEELYPRLKSRM